MRIMFDSLRLAAAAALFAAPACAQDAAPAPSAAASAAAPALSGGAPDPAAGGAPQKPVHPAGLLDKLNGGPEGSPTAQRGNPQPGTSTSIPTTNPAPIRPVQQQGPASSDLAVENTGIEGQCDPVVRIGCPSVTGPPKAGIAGAQAGDAQASATGDAPAGATQAAGAARPAAGQAAPEQPAGPGN